MKLSSLCSLVGLLLVSNQTLAHEKYDVVPELSSVSFSTVKGQYVVEPASIKFLTGTLGQTGKFDIVVGLKNIDTGISIRDSRINDLFFNAAKYPEVKVSGKVDMRLIQEKPQTLVIPAQVTMYGKTKSIDLSVVVIDAGNYLMVSSSKPVIIRASDFGIPTGNLKKLADTVGGIKISDHVPLTLTVVFES
ncbi:YceI family protein [Vibrio campbellii]|uniref:YceI family protein n=1 Tax=Vibrio campbellii TaxID=680 RepID=UPI000CD33A78|nr:YceI family protein [Vibrio campbellii]AUW07507.1 hypothetical protein C1N51_28230 [Vibrio campbellii]